jgi:hypothetical protein
MSVAALLVGEWFVHVKQNVNGWDVLAVSRLYESDLRTDERLTIRWRCWSRTV